MKLGELIRPAKSIRAGDTEYPILSMTMRNGLVPQGEKFKKRVAGADLSQYKVVENGQLVVGFPIDEAVLAFQRSIPAGIVSPAYAVWDISDKASVDPLYLERFLRSPIAVAFYLAKLQGSTARRRSLPNPVFLDMEVPLPPLEEQRRIAAILDKADELRTKRRAALAHLDTLTRSIFHSMFEDGEWSRMTLRDASLRFVGGRNLVGSGANVHPENKVLKVNAVSGGFFDPDQTKPLPIDYVPPAEHLVRPGDLIVTRASGTKDLIGVATPVSHVRGRTYLPDKLWRAQMDPELLCPTFFRFLTKSVRYRDFVVNSSSGAAGVSNISQAKLLMFEFGLPPLELQQTFATRVAAVERLKELHRKHLAKLDALFASLQHRAFKGEL